MNLIKNLMYLFMYVNSIISLPIVNNECCVTYSYGSRMEKINIELNNNLTNCISPNEPILGYNYEVYNTSCKGVEDSLSSLNVTSTYLPMIHY